jgi:hypothetical protein
VAIEAAGDHDHAGRPPRRAGCDRPHARDDADDQAESLAGIRVQRGGNPDAAGVLCPVTGRLLSPTIASGGMALSSVSVGMNSLRLVHAGGHSSSRAGNE